MFAFVLSVVTDSPCLVQFLSLTIPPSLQDVFFNTLAPPDVSSLWVHLNSLGEPMCERECVCRCRSEARGEVVCGVAGLRCREAVSEGEGNSQVY